MDTKLLEGERALVTGCGSGIGRGIAKALKAEGATVLGSDVAAPPAEDGIDFLAADLGQSDGWRTLLDNAVQRLGSISLFVHAASPRRLEVDTPPSVSEETWDAMTGINLRAGFFLARVLAPSGIRVNAIAPGAIPGGGFVAGNLAELVAQIPLGRAGTPDDIAQAAVAVLSERFGRYVVGTTVEVDGGLGLVSWIPAKA